MALGDITGEKPDLLAGVRRSLGTAGIPVFALPGNHDKYKVDDATPRDASYFRYTMGPVDYSFNRGDVHVVCMDDVIYTSGTEYTNGFTDAQLAWLRADLSFVPKQKMVILCYHIPLRSGTARNMAAVKALLSEYAEAHLMAAHTHYNENFINTDADGGLYEHIHGAPCGVFWHSALNGDGTPNGFMVYEIDGTKIVDTYFKASQRPDDHQIRLYHGDAVFAGPYATYKYDLGTDVVVANVFAAGMDGTTWKVELSEDGGKTWSDMSPIEQNYGDRWIRGYHIGVEHHPTESGTSPCYHQYQYKLKDAAATAIEVRATDSFGHVYTQDTFTADNDFTEAEKY